MLNIKKVLSLLVLIIVVFGNLNTVFAEDIFVPDYLNDYGAQIYAGARSNFSRRSFSGYCGTYVKCQLIAMGILDRNTPLHGNGNKWYGLLKDIDKTSTGYFAYSEGGADCLARLTEKYGNDLKNIVVSLPIQAHYSARYPGAGHAFIIYELKNGIAYYSESFSFGGHREGSVIAEPVEKLLERYSKRHGSPLGAVMFSKEDLDLKKAMELGVLTQNQKEDILAQIENLSDFTYLANEVIYNTQAVLA